MSIQILPGLNAGHVTRFYKFTILTSNFKWKIFSNFVAFSEYLNFKYATNVLDSFIKIGDMQSKLKKKSDDQFLDDMKVAGYFRPRTLQPQLTRHSGYRKISSINARF